MNKSDFNVQSHRIEPYVLIDELSENEIYIGTSNSFSDRARPTWRIKRIIKIGTVWQMEYPDGNQDFSFIWNNRFAYSYR